MKRHKILLLVTFLVGMLVSCNDEPQLQNPIAEKEYDMTGFAKGADVSWITEMENSGVEFYDTTGTKTECMHLMRDMGMNSIRLRVWVDPDDGWCNEDDLLIKAWRANNLGMRLMIDFHYSDSWADPGQQNKPSAWEGLSLDAMTDSLYNYTVSVLQTLKDNNITPEWVQIGNETTGGMLWDNDEAISGALTANNGANYVKLHNAGYDAAKSVFPDTKVVLHIDRGQQLDISKRVLTYIVPNNVKLDILGLSIYPDPDNWEEYTKSCIENMQWIVDNYGYKVMICETGMSHDQATIAKKFLSKLITQTQTIVDSKGNQMGTGVFYWEPEAYNSWNNYTKGAFNNDGTPTKALDAFLEN